MNDLNQILAGDRIHVDALELLAQTSRVEIRGLTIPGSQAIETWAQLKEMANKTGYWPILMGDSDDKERLLESLEVWEDEESSTIIAKGLTLDLEAWLENRKGADLQYYTPPRGSWPEEIPLKDNFYVHLDHRSGQPVREIYLAMLPTEKGWQTPAFVKFGGWNYCPSPEVHVAASKNGNNSTRLRL